MKHARKATRAATLSAVFLAVAGFLAGGTAAAEWDGLNDLDATTGSLFETCRAAALSVAGEDALHQQAGGHHAASAIAPMHPLVPGKRKPSLLH